VVGSETFQQLASYGLPGDFGPPAALVRFLWSRLGAEDLLFPAASFNWVAEPTLQQLASYGRQQPTNLLPHRCGLGRYALHGLLRLDGSCGAILSRLMALGFTRRILILN